MEILNSRQIDYTTPVKIDEINKPRNLKAKTSIFTKEIPGLGMMPQGKPILTPSLLHPRMLTEGDAQIDN